MIHFLSATTHQAFVLFAKMQKEWRDAITRLAQDKALRQENVAKALAYVKARRMHAQQAPKRIAYYANLVQNRNMLEQQRQKRIIDMAK